MKFESQDVLSYNQGRSPQATVKRYYLYWRQQQIPPIPLRCDNPECIFHNNPIVWNGMPLKLILDHIEGVNGDNRPKKLQLLCPNCDSQLHTKGGRNKNRVEQFKGGYLIKQNGGKKEYTLPARTFKHQLVGGKAKFTITRGRKLVDLS